MQRIVDTTIDTIYNKSVENIRFLDKNGKYFKKGEKFVTNKVNAKGKNQEVKGFFKAVERVGNALPHPAILFLIMSVILVIASALLARMNVTVDYFDAKKGEEVQLAAVSLLNPEGIRYIFNSSVSNFTGFAPLGTVLVAMLGVAMSEHTGLFEVGLKQMLLGVNSRVLTATVVFAGIMSNIASDAGYVVVVPLGAMIFASVNRHPVAGLAAAFAGVSGGFSANLLLGTTDPLLTGITNQALEAAHIDMTLDATCNWYFLAASTFILTIIGTIVTEKIVEPNLGKYTGSYVHEERPTTPLERKGLKWAGISVIVYLVIMGLCMFGPTAIFREPGLEGIAAIKGFLHDGLILAILLLFFIPGYIFGKITGKIKDSKDVIKIMTKGMQGMGSYLVLAFFAAQFIAYFSKTNIGIIISVSGANFLKSIGLSGIPLILIFVLLSAFLNLFMGSASAKWAIMAPIFVPMLMAMNIHPALTQVAYRVGDSSTNIISPLMSYFAMIVVFMQKYEEDKGLGTLISTMLPYSLAFLIFWTLFIVVWMLLGIPVGPGAPLYLG